MGFHFALDCFIGGFFDEDYAEHPGSGRCSGNDARSGDRKPVPEERTLNTQMPVPSGAGIFSFPSPQGCGADHQRCHCEEGFARNPTWQSHGSCGFCRHCPEIATVASLLRNDRIGGVPLALPLGELSPQVTERASALPAHNPSVTLR